MRCPVCRKILSSVLTLPAHYARVHPDRPPVEWNGRQFNQTIKPDLTEQYVKEHTVATQEARRRKQRDMHCLPKGYKAAQRTLADREAALRELG